MKHYWIVIFSMLLVACVPEPIPLKIDQAESKIVVSTQIIPDRGMIMILTRSFSALSDGTQGDFRQEDLQKYLVNDAEVEVSYDNQSYRLEQIGNGLYGSIEIQQTPGKLYDLSIIDQEEGNVVTAQTKVKEPVVIQNGSAIIDRQETTSIWLRMFINFNDPFGTNYYMFNAYVNPKTPDFEGLLNGTGNISGGENIGGSKGGGAPDEAFGLNNLFSDFSESWVFTDEGLDGTSIQKEFIVYNIDVKPEDVVVYTLTNISEEYYNFLNSRERSVGNIPFITEPVSLPSNIEGGLGYFAMHYPVPFAVQLREE